MENITTKTIEKSRYIEKTNVYSGNCELIDSNTVVFFFADKPIEIEENFSNGFKVLIRIMTTKDETGNRDIKISVDKESNLIEYTCINFDNSLGTGTTKAIELGTLGDKKLYIHFWIYAMGENDNIARKLEYSIWKER